MDILSQNNRTANFSTANTIKTILIDDYQEAIDNLKSLLCPFNEIEIIGEACNVKDGLHKII